MKTILLSVVVTISFLRVCGQSAFSPKEYADHLMHCYNALEIYTHIFTSEELRAHIATSAAFLGARLDGGRKLVISKVGEKDEKEVDQFIRGCLSHMVVPPSNAQEMDALRVWCILYKDLIRRVYIKLEKS